jgi:hypothetical protein
MKSEDAWAQITCGTGAAAPAQQAGRWTGAPEQTLDAAAWDQWPAAGTDNRADNPFIHTAVADQPPIDLCLNDPQTVRGEWRGVVHTFDPLIDPGLNI